MANVTSFEIGVQCYRINFSLYFFFKIEFMSVRNILSGSTAVFKNPHFRNDISWAEKHVFYRHQ